MKITVLFLLIGVIVGFSSLPRFGRVKGDSAGSARFDAGMMPIS